MESINYLEFASRDLSITKAFFTNCFDWQFTDYGDEYMAFDAQGFQGGFYFADLQSTQATGGCLVVFYSEALEQSLEKVVSNGGNISREIFDFPGGRRFHFMTPCGNEFAIWSDK